MRRVCVSGGLLISNSGKKLGVLTSNHYFVCREWTAFKNKQQKQEQDDNLKLTRTLRLCEGPAQKRGVCLVELLAILLIDLACHATAKKK